MPAPYYPSGDALCRDHVVAVPLDHTDPTRGTIDVFAREVVAAGRDPEELPWLLFLQGGPGGKAPRPNSKQAWLAPALRHFRVLLLDQRGTGRSTPVNRQTLAGMTPVDAAEHLTRFRADAIVRDAEVLRRQVAGGEPWTVLGQSFGGFCAVTYLSYAPEGLREVLIAGGLPPLDARPDDVYRRAYPRMSRRNERFFARHPVDAEVAHEVVEHLARHDERLPGGERLTARRFLTIGIRLGEAARVDDLHHLLEEAFVRSGSRRVLSDTFLRGVDDIVSFATAPLYALLHEPIYCEGTAARWSAHRLRDAYPEFHLDRSGPLRFTGEMIYPWMFDEDPALVPLREAADLLARRDDWGPLYDLERLAVNEVPAAAVVYDDDLFVDRDDSLATAARIRGLRTWVSADHEHDGIRVDPAVVERLLRMVRGEG